MKQSVRVLGAALALTLVGVLSLVFALRGGSARPAGPVALADGWRYRWGNSPRDAQGRLLWLAEPAGDAWGAIEYPSNPPGREGRQNAWFRVKVPVLAVRDPALFIYSIDINAELYLDGRPLYAWGELGETGSGSFLGWPWHLVELPPMPAGGSSS